MEWIPSGLDASSVGAVGISIFKIVGHRSPISRRALTYRIIAIAGGNLKTVTCSVSVLLLSGAKGVPSWFHDLDTNRDGQVSISEWRKSGRKIADFRKYDLNCDGFISPGEALQMVKKASQLELKNGKAEYKGTIEEEIEARYQGRKSFKIFTIKMEQGKTYQIEMVSPVFFAFLYLEAPGGRVLIQANSFGRDKIARITHRAIEAGTYRIIATSQDGFRTGACTLSVRLLPGIVGTIPKGVPAWFAELDTNKDGQVSLYEWRKAGRKTDDFLKYDLDGDGFITASEILRYLKSQSNRPKPGTKRKY